MISKLLSHKALWRSLTVLSLSFGLGLLALYWLVGPALLSAETYHLRNLEPSIIAFCLIILLTYWFFPVLRLKLLCAYQGLQLSILTSFMVQLSTNFGALIMPGKLGGVPVLILALQKLGLPLGAGIGLVAQLILLDLAYFAFLVPLSVLYVFSTGMLSLPPTVSYLVLALSILLFLLGITLSFLLKLSRPLLSRFGNLPLFRALTKHFEKRTLHIARDYQQSVTRFSDISVLQRLSLQLLTMLGWLSRSTLLWGLLVLFDVHTLLLNILTSLNIINLLSSIMPTPGGSGFVEIAIGWSLRTRQVEAILLASPILLWRLLTYYINFALGPLSTWLLYRKTRQSLALTK